MDLFSAIEQNFPSLESHLKCCLVSNNFLILFQEVFPHLFPACTNAHTVTKQFWEKENEPYTTCSFLLTSGIFYMMGRPGLYFSNSFWENKYDFPFQYFLKQPMFTILTNTKQHSSKYSLALCSSGKWMWNSH